MIVTLKSLKQIDLPELKKRTCKTISKKEYQVKQLTRSVFQQFMYTDLLLDVLAETGAGEKSF